MGNGLLLGQKLTPLSFVGSWPNVFFEQVTGSATSVGPPPSEIHQAAHLNGVRDDNRLANLEWKTPKENDRDKDVHGTRQDNKKLTAEQVAEIRATPPVIGEHTAEKLGAKYGVSDSCIRYVWRGNVTYPISASSA